MKIAITNVGRRKVSTTIDVSDDLCADDVAHWILKAVRKLGALMSRDVICTWDEQDRTGGVYAGGRLVGASRVVSP